MSVVTFTSNQISKLLSICDSSSQERYEAALGENQIPKEYGSSMGRVLLAAELEASKKKLTAELEAGKKNLAQEIKIDLFKVCKGKQDTRCQVGHVKSNLESRIEKSDSNSKLKRGYNAFMKNARATTLLLDKRKLVMDTPNNKGKIRINSVECRKWLDLSAYGGGDKILCKTYHYAEELIPKTEILGSGFFIAHDRVLTAAHVLERAWVLGMSPDDLMLIRGHFVYDSEAKSIEVFGDQLYIMDQVELIMSERNRYGDLDGDMAWIQVKPLDKAFSLKWNGFVSAPVEKGTQVYALGHGLGLPMKISYWGEVSNGSFGQASTMFECKMNILPGNSGAPIFDTNSHKLVGIIRGIIGIDAEPDPVQDCVNLKIKNHGVATHVAPFDNLT